MEVAITMTIVLVLLLVLMTALTADILVVVLLTKWDGTFPGSSAGWWWFGGRDGGCHAHLLLCFFTCICSFPLPRPSSFRPCYVVYLRVASVESDSWFE